MSVSLASYENPAAWSENPQAAIQSVARLYEQALGLKLGRGILAERAGLSDRRLKALLVERARPYADEYIRVHAAHMVLRRERAAAIRAELASLEMELLHDATYAIACLGVGSEGVADARVVAGRDDRPAVGGRGEDRGMGR
jgi:hypothetical protein